MAIRLSDEARQYIATFTAETGAVATDCLVGDDIVFVVAPDDMGLAIGPDGRTVGALEERLGRDVVLIEDAETPEVFVANALAPAAVYDVTVREADGDTIALATVDDADVGVAIGPNGRRIDLARRLAARHFDLDGIEVQAAE